MPALGCSSLCTLGVVPTFQVGGCDARRAARDGRGQLEHFVLGGSLVLAGKAVLLMPGRGLIQMLNICRANQLWSAFVQGMLVRRR